MFLARLIITSLSLVFAIGCQAQSPEKSNGGNAGGAIVTPAGTAPVVSNPDTPTTPVNPPEVLDVQPTNEPPTLTLNQTIAWALEKNPEVRRAAKRVDEFKAYAEVAKRKILPGIGVTATASRSDLGYGTQSYAVGINHTVWDGTYSPNLMMNGFRLMAEQERQKMVQRQVALQAATAYLSLIRSLGMDRAQKATHQATQRVYLQVKVAYGLGLATKQQLFQAESELKKAELAVKQSGSAIRTSCLAILNATATTQVSVCDRPASPDQPTVAIPETPDEALKTALLNRPEPKIEIYMVEAAKKGVKIARADYFPKVSVNAHYGYSDSPFGGSGNFGGAPTGPGSLEPDWSVGVSISVPIFDWGTRKKKVEAAQAQVDQALASKETTELQVANNILTLLSQLEVAGQSVETAAVGFQSADNAFKETDAAYKLGGVSLTDLMLRLSERLAAEQRLIEAQSNLVQTLLSTKIALGEDIGEAQ